MATLIYACQYDLFLSAVSRESFLPVLIIFFFNLKLSLILTTNRKRKYFEKYLAFSQASWAVSAIFFVKEIKNKRKKSENIYIYFPVKIGPYTFTT